MHAMNPVTHAHAAKMSLQEVRRRFHVMKEPVFGQKFMSTRSGTDNLTRELKDMFGTMTMDEVKIPRFEHLINKLRPL